MPKNIRLVNNNTINPFGASRRLEIVLTLVAGLTSGCTRGGPSAPPAAVRFDLAADPRSLNPLFSNPDAASVEQQISRLTFEPFVDLDASGRPVPVLLSEIPSRANGGVSPDGRTIRYRLRPGVRWSDGRPVTADDVLFTLRAILDPHNPVRSHEGYDLIALARAPDAKTVIFRLKRPWAPAVTTFFPTASRRSSCFRRTCSARRRRLPGRHSTHRPRSATDRSASSRGGAANRCAIEPIRAYWRGAPPVAELSIGTIPDPSTNLLMLQIRRAGLESDRAGANCRRPPRSATRVPSRPNGRRRRACAQYLAAAARRPPSSEGARDVDRPQCDRRQDHAGSLSRHQHDSAKILVGIRSGRARARIRSARCRPAF